MSSESSSKLHILQDIIMVTLVFRMDSELLLLQNAKNDQNGTNFLGTSLKTSFQLFITQQERKKSR